MLVQGDVVYTLKKESNKERKDFCKNETTLIRKYYIILQAFFFDEEISKISSYVRQCLYTSHGLEDMVCFLLSKGFQDLNSSSIEEDKRVISSIHEQLITDYGNDWMNYRSLNKIHYHISSFRSKILNITKVDRDCAKRRLIRLKNLLISRTMTEEESLYLFGNSRMTLSPSIAQYYDSTSDEPISIDFEPFHTNDDWFSFENDPW